MPLVIETDNNTPNEPVSFSAGGKFEDALLRALLPSNPRGFYGHQVFYGSINNLDLMAVLSHIDGVQIVRQEPEIMAPKYPENARS